MGLKTRLSSYCSKQGDNTMNLVTSRKTNARLARPIVWMSTVFVCAFARAVVGDAYLCQLAARQVDLLA